MTPSHRRCGANGPELRPLVRHHSATNRKCQCAGTTTSRTSSAAHF
jgi:hypothetical protein